MMSSNNKPKKPIVIIAKIMPNDQKQAYKQS